MPVKVKENGKVTTEEAMQVLQEDVKQVDAAFLQEIQDVYRKHNREIVPALNMETLQKLMKQVVIRRTK